MVNRENLHFVIKIRGEGGIPVFYLVRIDAANKLYVERSDELPEIAPLENESAVAGSHILDMTKFTSAEILQIVDSVPKIKAIGSTLRGTIYQTKMRAWNLIQQEETEIELSATNEAHLVFSAGYKLDTVNFISLYNYAHDDEVVAMITKRGTEAQILLFDVKLGVLDLARQAGRYTFLTFIKNFREAFCRFGEQHHPEGEVARLSTTWRRTSNHVIFEIPEGLTAKNHDHIEKLLRELYGLKIILAASLMDRCAKNSTEYQTAKTFLRSFLPKAVTTEKRFLSRGQSKITWSRVVFGQSQLDELFDKMPHEPARLHVGPEEDGSNMIVIDRDDLESVPPEFEDFWHGVKIDIDDND